MSRLASTNRRRALSGQVARWFLHACLPKRGKAVHQSRYPFKGNEDRFKKFVPQLIVTRRAPLARIIPTAQLLDFFLLYVRVGRAQPRTRRESTAEDKHKCDAEFRQTLGHIGRSRATTRPQPMRARIVLGSTAKRLATVERFASSQRRPKEAAVR
jgi:hypothetical protein